MHVTTRRKGQSFPLTFGGRWLIVPSMTTILRHRPHPDQPFYAEVTLGLYWDELAGQWLVTVTERATGQRPRTADSLTTRGPMTSEEAQELLRILDVCAHQWLMTAIGTQGALF